MSSHHDPNDDLIQRDIDGRITEDERTRLAALLASDPVSREEHRRLAGLRDLLASLPQEEPPAQLSIKVLRDIRARRGARAAWGFWPGGRLALGYGYAAAAGAALAILAVHVATGGRAFGPDPSPRNAAATIGSPVAPAAGGPWLSFHNMDKNIAVDVAAPGKGALEVTVAYDAKAFQLLGITNPNGGLDQLSASDGQIRWSQKRPQRVTLVLAPRSESGARLDVKYTGERGIWGVGNLDLPGVN
jgi:anti-sigma factor RsiW